MVVTSGGNVALTDANAITVGASSVGGTFDIIAASTTFLGAFSANNYSFSGGSYTLAAGTYNLGGTTTVTGSASVFMTSATINGAGGTFNVSGLLDTGTGTLTTGTLNVLAGGTLKGTGTIQGNVNNSAGTVSPGASPGIHDHGNYTQGASVRSPWRSADLSPVRTMISCGERHTSDGTLNTSLLGGFVPLRAAPYVHSEQAWLPARSHDQSALGHCSPLLVTTFEFIATGLKTVPVPIQPTFNYTNATIDQIITGLTQSTTSSLIRGSNSCRSPTS